MLSSIVKLMFLFVEKYRLEILLMVLYLAIGSLVYVVF